MDHTKPRFSISGNALKVLAAISMTVDHVGVMIFPQNQWLRIIGRLAFPIFSYMICEGCRYTRRKTVYLLRIMILGIVTTAVSAFATGELYFNTLITFSCSILLILLLTKAAESNTIHEKSVYLAVFSAAVLLIFTFTRKFTVDYGFIGVILPVFPCVGEMILPAENNSPLSLTLKFWAFGAGLAILSFDFGWIQPYSLLALIPLALYNGSKGFYLPKYSFYVFYPLHVVIIYLLSMTI